MDLTLIIPCYNEADSVDQLQEQLSLVRTELERRGSFELVFVDDGSQDGTADLLLAAFENWPARVIRHARNMGLGGALRTGFRVAAGDIIVTIDSDCTYPPSTIPAMLDRLTSRIDIVTASPYHPQGGVDGVPAYRLALSRGASLLYRLLVDFRLHTFTAMYRAYRREVIERIATESNGFLMVTELLVRARLAGYRVAEFPTVLHVRRYGQSKARVIRVTREHLRFQRQLLLSRLVGPVPAFSKAK